MGPWCTCTGVNYPLILCPSFSTPCSFVRQFPVLHFPVLQFQSPLNDVFLYTGHTTNRTAWSEMSNIQIHRFAETNKSLLTVLCLPCVVESLLLALCPVIYANEDLCSVIGTNSSIQFAINSPPIEVSNSWPHLGHVISWDKDDKSNIRPPRMSFGRC